MRRTPNLMIESNYDAEMLRNGRYPVHLKSRIASTTGHLDNADTARYLAAIAKQAGLKHVFLCHLSQDNNTPQIAISTVRSALESAGIGVTHENAIADSRMRLSVLPRSEATSLIVLD